MDLLTFNSILLIAGIIVASVAVLHLVLGWPWLGACIVGIPAGYYLGNGIMVVIVLIIAKCRR